MWINVLQKNLYLHQYRSSAGSVAQNWSCSSFGGALDGGGLCQKWLDEWVQRIVLYGNLCKYCTEKAKLDPFPLSPTDGLTLITGIGSRKKFFYYSCYHPHECHINRSGSPNNDHNGWKSCLLLVQALQMALKNARHFSLNRIQAQERIVSSQVFRTQLSLAIVKITLMHTACKYPFFYYTLHHFCWPGKFFLT